jgi:hypothetical protein
MVSEPPFNARRKEKLENFFVDYLVGRCHHENNEYE